jgi:hypothetical protein
LWSRQVGHVDIQVGRFEVNLGKDAIINFLNEHAGE